MQTGQRCGRRLSRHLRAFSVAGEEVSGGKMWRIGKCQILEGFKAKPRSLGFLGIEDKLDGLNSEAT